MEKIISSPIFLLVLLWIAVLFAHYCEWKEGSPNIGIKFMIVVAYILLLVCTGLLISIEGLK